MKPEKILAKKYVRSKPYYKVKWDGLGKEEASWETPPTLRQYKKMINEYEMKNWGSPLDEKYFDSAIYMNKGFPHRSKILSKKKKIDKKLKKKLRKKIEEYEYESESEESEEEEQASPSYNFT